MYVGSSKNIHSRFEQHLSSRTKWFKDSTRKDFEIYLLEEVSCVHLLTSREQYYLDKLKPTLNNNNAAGLPPVRTGEDNNKSKYSNHTYREVFKVLASGSTVSATVESTGVSKDVVKGIYSLKAHTWLHTEMPWEHQQLLKIRQAKLGKEKVTVYHEEFGEYELSKPFSDFCNKFNLPNNGNVGRLYNGTRKSYKGWRVK